MANIKSAKKRIRVTAKKTEVNLAHKTKVKTYVKKVKSAITAEATNNLAEILHDAVKVIDTVAQKGVIHKNKAARLKSRLAKKVNKLSEAGSSVEQKAATEPKKATVKKTATKSASPKAAVPKKETTKTTTKKSAAKAEVTTTEK